MRVSAVHISSWGAAFVVGLGAAACDLDGRALDVVRPEAVVEAGPTPPGSRDPDDMDTGTEMSPPEECEDCTPNDECAALGANARCRVNGRAGECSAGTCREYCVVDVSRVDECLVQ